MLGNSIFVHVLGELRGTLRILVANLCQKMPVVWVSPFSMLKAEVKSHYWSSIHQGAESISRGNANPKRCPELLLR